jgi:HSP20 family protein
VTTTPGVRGNGPSLVGELMSWLGNPPTRPEIRVEEYQEGDRRVIRSPSPRSAERLGVVDERSVTLQLASRASASAEAESGGAV